MIGSIKGICSYVIHVVRLSWIGFDAMRLSRMAMRDVCTNIYFESCLYSTVHTLCLVFNT